MRSFVYLASFIFLAFASLNPALGQTNKTQATIIELEQTPQAFVQTKLELEPGNYIFKVTNKNVDKKLGFYLTERKADGSDGKQVKNSGTKLIAKGKTQSTGVVTLAPGVYNYSCPLNPTPHYTITVKAKE